MLKLLGITKLIIIASLLAGSAALLVVSLPGSGWKALSVQTGSMKPAIDPGDLVFARSVPAPDIKVGDVVTYISPANPTQTITHRVTEIKVSPNGLNRFVTKGDANPTQDPIVYQSQVIGVTKFTIPNLGALFDWLKTWPGLITTIYLPSLIIVAIEIRKLTRYYKSLEPYVATGYDPNQPQPPRGKRFVRAGAVATIAAVSIAVPVAHAALMSTATLTNNTIATAPVPPSPGLDYPVISRVTFDSTTTGSNNTNINVTNNNPQTATSGNASGSNATSGNASNSSNTSINISVNGNQGGANSGGTPATVTIFNPTGAALDLTGWTLTDNNASHAIPTGTIIVPQASYTFTWPTVNGLERTNDRLILRNTAATAIDALSWGNDTSQLNPAVTTTATTASLVRNDTSADNNAASDWTAAP